jgi:ElaB/YqjD/DUF883 family membrane-anchored ribosome-binding protein
MQTKTSLLDTSSNGQDASSPTPSTRVAAAPTAVASEFHSFVDDIEDLVKATTSLTGEDLARARAKLAKRLEAVKHSVGVMGSEIAQRTRNTARATDDYVHGHPWQAIGIGTAVGVLLGLVLARR